MMERNTEQYFATLDTEEIGDEIWSRIEGYYDYVETSGQLDLWQNCYDTYHQSAHSDGKMYVSGEQGEFLNLGANHFRNILKHMQQLTIQERPAFDCKAANSDYKSQAQCDLGSSLLEYYLREKQLENVIVNSLEYATLLSEGYIHARWKVNDGEIYGVNPDTQSEVREGDMDYQAHGPLDIVRDPYKNRWSKNQWLMVREKVNRFDLIKEHPDLEDKIREIQNAKDAESEYETSFTSNSEAYEDDIFFFTFYHKPTPSVPNGRMIEILSADCILIDTPLPYREVPIYPIRPETRMDTNFGYSPSFDLLPIQEMLNGLYSTIATNQKAFGVQSILIERGSDITVDELAKGLRAMYYNAKENPPTPLQLTATPPEIFEFLQMLVHDLETLSGVNSVARGNPEASLKSGAALALVQSQALQFSQGLQHSYIKVLEQVGTATINILKDFAKVPRVAMISGKSKQALMKEFKGDDLNQINRVLVEVANPLTKTISGRTQLAETFVQNGMIDVTDQYLQVVATGKLEPLTEGKQQSLMNIKYENEAIVDGKPVKATFVDDHITHILEHRNVLANPEARKDQKLIERTFNHIQEHVDLLRTTDPMLLQLLKQQEALSYLGPAPGQQPPKQNQSAGPAGEVLNNTNPMTQAAAKVNQPNMPKNALTGEQYQPPQ